LWKSQSLQVPTKHRIPLQKSNPSQKCKHSSSRWPISSPKRNTKPNKNSDKQLSQEMLILDCIWLVPFLHSSFFDFSNKLIGFLWCLWWILRGNFDGFYGKLAGILGGISVKTNLKINCQQWTLPPPPLQTKKLHHILRSISPTSNL
jgi:hypothetical protein